jgi:hypothetical protein
VNRRLYLTLPDKKDYEEGKKSCILRHAKRCCHRSSQVQDLSPRVGGDVDLREVSREVDIGKR